MTWRKLVLGIGLSSLALGCQTEPGDTMKASDYFMDARLLSLAESAASGDRSGIETAIRMGAEVNAAGERGMTSLLWAVHKHSVDGVRYLLAGGADPNYIADNGDSAVTLASRSENSALLDALLKAGATPNTFDHNADTALIKAAGGGFLNNTRLLVQHGADLDARNKTGMTAVLQAATLNQFEVAAFLLESGADHTARNSTGGSVAFVVQDRNQDPNSDGYEWQQRARQLLVERGVEFPVPSPWQERYTEASRNH